LIEIGVLVSGRGSNLESILNSAEKGAIGGAEVSVVISNKPEARALRVARSHGVKAVSLPDAHVPRDAYGGLLAEALEKNGVTPERGLVLLAGFMKILPRAFVELYQGRLMNIHPSLLPAFPGLNAQRQAIAYGAKVSGCTVHFVAPEVDSGPIIAQRAVPVLEGDNEASLSARILSQEHRLYPLAVKLFAQGNLRIKGRRVVVEP
jgi:phosphoribosylglycinamide formyltransferase 1